MTYTITQRDGAVLYSGPSAQTAWLYYDVLDQLSRTHPRHTPELAARVVASPDPPSAVLGGSQIAPTPKPRTEPGEGTGP